LGYPIPVAIFLYNRPEKLDRVFASVTAARPRELLLIADGPKDAADARGCSAARAVVEELGWECEVSRLYSPVNLGCHVRVRTGLDWVFSRVDRAVILEDDCVPAASFFPFCAALLEYYRDDYRIMDIAGSNFRVTPRPYSYYFSAYAGVWGWATWRRAWLRAADTFERWPELDRMGLLESVCTSGSEVRLWRSRFDAAYGGRQILPWDWQWHLTLWAENGLSAVPSANLVSNIGFGRGATHTKRPGHPGANRPLASIDDISHPPAVFRDRAADRWLFDNIEDSGRLKYVRRALRLAADHPFRSSGSR
jgi:hypothetical protein